LNWQDVDGKYFATSSQIIDVAAVEKIFER